MLTAREKMQPNFFMVQASKRQESSYPLRMRNKSNDSSPLSKHRSISSIRSRRTLSGDNQSKKKSSIRSKSSISSNSRIRSNSRKRNYFHSIGNDATEIISDRYSGLLNPTHNPNESAMTIPSHVHSSSVFRTIATTYRDRNSQGSNGGSKTTIKRYNKDISTPVLKNRKPTKRKISAERKSL